MKKRLVLLLCLFTCVSAFAEFGEYNGYAYTVNYITKYNSEEELDSFINERIGKVSEEQATFSKVTKMTKTQKDVIKTALSNYDTEQGDVYIVAMSEKAAPRTTSQIIYSAFIYFTSNNEYICRFYLCDLKK